MKLRQYTIRDIKAERYLIPFCAPTDAVAIRNFQNWVDEPGTDLNKHPEDYTLHETGQFDEETGVTEGLAMPKYITQAKRSN